MHDHDSVGEDPVNHGTSAPESTPSHGGIRTGRAVAGAAAAIAVAVYAWWVVGLPPFAGRATAGVLAAGAAATAAGGLSRHPSRRPRVQARAASAWAALVAGTGTWQLAAYLQHPRADHPTLSSLTNALLDSHPARAAAFVVWIVAAAGLARR